MSGLIVLAGRGVQNILLYINVILAGLFGAAKLIKNHLEQLIMKFL